MWWAYLLVFIATIIVDITPIPLPPAFTVMIILQAVFNLAIWPVIIIGVIGSAIGRYILSIYITDVAGRLLDNEKITDIRFLGDKISTTGLRSQLFTLAYTLLPISSTPLFITAGIAKLKPIYIIPAFIVGKFVSDSIAVIMGKYAIDNSQSIFSDAFSPKSIFAILIYLILLMAVLFIDWRKMLLYHKMQFKWNIWKKRKP
jgi:membrane protein DedA with SNARE-associated domain